MKFTFLFLCIVTFSLCSDVTHNELYQRIHEEIIKKAKEKQDQMNKATPKRAFPSLSAQIQNHKQQMLNPNEKKSLLSYPTSLFKTCIYPFASENHVKYCNKEISEKKRGACLSSMCQVCCDNLPLMYKSAINDIPLGKMLNLTNEDVSKIISLNMIHNCKRECSEVYPVPKLN